MPRFPVALALPLLLAACGGGTKDNAPPATPPTLTIRATGVEPKSLVTGSSGSVNVTNSDTVAHQLVSAVVDPTKCPASANLGPGQSGSLRFSVGPYTCNYQDVAAPTDANFHAAVDVAAPGAYP